MLKYFEELLPVDELYQIDETEAVNKLLESNPLSAHDFSNVENLAQGFINEVRQHQGKIKGLDAFLAEYDLSSDEGITLMCLAEALLRIPDKLTMDKFIADKLSSADWEQHLGKSSSLFVNASTWGLLLTGKVLHSDEKKEKNLSSSFKSLLKNRSAPVIRKIVLQAMKILGQQFVMASTIKAGLKSAKKSKSNYSFDMLGEAAMTESDALHYLKEYTDAATEIGKAMQGTDVHKNSGISVKLSALYPRYELSKHKQVFEILYPRLKSIALLAKQYHIGLTVDAEEARRLTLSLALFKMLALDPDLQGWQGLGLAVQAYQKRAPRVLEWLNGLAKQSNRRFMVRLVKGAYWDSEIKLAQVNGYANYPVFTRKDYTDVSYICMAHYMLQHTEQFYCQFATHNAYTLACVLAMAGNYKDFEFQRLHGMGEELHEQLAKNEATHIPTRIYAPVGAFDLLLAYLVRRLLENGANTSFVNRLLDANTSIDKLTQNPFTLAEEYQGTPNPNIPLPSHIYGEQRKNSIGINLDHLQELIATETALTQTYATMPWHATPLLASKTPQADRLVVTNPGTKQEPIGSIVTANVDLIEPAIEAAAKAFQEWRFEPVNNNEKRLHNMANLLEENMTHLMAITIKEAGKTYANAINEIREAIDFCRYYALQANTLLQHPTTLVGPTGEENQLSLHPRGLIICISPWNFPIAIFLGEITAALATGNVVITKPSMQTSIVAYEVIKLLHQAGFPKDVIQYLPGSGSQLGTPLVSHPKVSGVIFTGSNATARSINTALANKLGPIAPFIAETGGQNCMIVDSSALPEQVVHDVITSAFDSAGQRCSALRVLYLQEEIADDVITMIKGAMQMLIVGNPDSYATDIGPVIDNKAKQALEAHCQQLKPTAIDFYQPTLNSNIPDGYYMLPTLIEIQDINELKQENFGPILHVIRYKAKNLIEKFKAVNSTGFGLTFGIHSRIQNTIDAAKKYITAGNVYINRNTVGAVVGVQPFGGEGISGTGPKAGGPHYLARLCVERSYSTDTTAAGGNASLLGLDEI